MKKTYTFAVFRGSQLVRRFTVKAVGRLHAHHIAKGMVTAGEIPVLLPDS